MVERGIKPRLQGKLAASKEPKGQNTLERSTSYSKQEDSAIIHSLARCSSDPTHSSDAKENVIR